MAVSFASDHARGRPGKVCSRLPHLNPCLDETNWDSPPKCRPVPKRESRSLPDLLLRPIGAFIRGIRSTWRCLAIASMGLGCLDSNVNEAIRRPIFPPLSNDGVVKWGLHGGPRKRSKSPVMAVPAKARWQCRCASLIDDGRFPGQTQRWCYHRSDGEHGSWPGRFGISGYGANICC